MTQPLSRRTVLLAAAAGALGIMGYESILASPAFASGRSLDTVLAEARGYVGDNYAGPWYGFNGYTTGDWCAQFVSWLLRGGVMPATAHVSSGSTSIRSHYASLGRLGATPTVGSLMIYGDPGDHVGIVENVANGRAIPIEGNAGTSTWNVNVVKWRDGNHGAGLGPYIAPTGGYAYPVYDGYDSMTGAGSPAGTTTTGQEDRMAILFNNNNTYQWGLAGLGQGPAAWIETTDATLAGKLGTGAGSPTVILTPTEWTTIKALFNPTT